MGFPFRDSEIGNSPARLSFRQAVEQCFYKLQFADFCVSVKQVVVFEIYFC